MSNIFIGLKKTCLGVLDTGRGEHDNDNETGLKEEGGIEMSTTVQHLCAALSKYLPSTIISLKIFFNVSSDVPLTIVRGFISSPPFLPSIRAPKVQK